MSTNAPEKTKSKEEVKTELYAQAEQQLIAAVDKADKAVNDAQLKLQQAQSDRIAVQAQLALIRKVNEKVEEFFLAKPTDAIQPAA